MANRVTVSDEFREYAVVDSSVGTGFFGGEVSMADLKNRKNITKIFFSIREEAEEGSIDSSEITVSLQFKCLGDERWQDFVSLDGSELAIGNCLEIKDSSSARIYRAGVKEGDYTSGSVIFGFDW